MLTETDHMFMAPPPNDALERRPVGFKFYYMTAMDPKLNPVVRKFLAPGIDPATVDQARMPLCPPPRVRKELPWAMHVPWAVHVPWAMHVCASSSRCCGVGASRLSRTRQNT